MFVVCAAVFLSVLNGTIVNVVLPTIGLELAVEPALLGWVVTAYSLVYAVAIPFFGRFADIFGARRLFVAGQAVFALGSLLCVLAPSFPLLVLARVIQAAGGAAIPGLGMTLATRAYPPHQIGVVVGLMSTGVGVAQAIGPTLGGVVATAFGWQAAFAVGTLAGVLVPASWVWLPQLDRKPDDAASTREPLDLWGGLFLAATISGGLLALTEAARHGPGAPTVWLAALLALSGLASLVFRQRTNTFPFIPREVLASPAFLAVSGITVCSTASSFGVIVGVPLLLARVNGLPASEIGLLMIPNALLAVSLGVLVGKLADRVGIRLPVRAGLLALLVSLAALSTAAGMSGWIISGLLAVLGVGTTLVYTALPASVSLILRPERLASGQGINSMLFFLGGSLGATLTTAVLTVRAEAADALNLIHSGSGVPFSDAFLLLMVPVALGLTLTGWVPGRPPTDRSSSDTMRPTSVPGE